MAISLCSRLDLHVFAECHQGFPELGKGQMSHAIQVFYPRFRFFTPRVESAPRPRARVARPLLPLPRPPLTGFAEGGAEGKGLSTKSWKKQACMKGHLPGEAATSTSSSSP